MTVIVAALSWSWLDASVDPLTGSVSADPRDRGAGRSDLAALEHALRLGERWKAPVVAATVGPGEADVMLRDALAAALPKRCASSWPAGPRVRGRPC